MQFQIASDLHTEFFTSRKDLQLSRFLTPSAPNLLLAGDIGNPNLLSYYYFLSQASKAFKKVFVSSGNHEYYQAKVEDEPRSRNEIKSHISTIVSEFPNVYFLNNSSVLLTEKDQDPRDQHQLPSDILILGTTLWTHVPWDARHVVETKVNDYNMIYNKNHKRVTTEDTNEWHEQSVSWLRRELARAQAIKPKYRPRVIVMSHHLPSFELVDPKYTGSGSPCNYAFASALDDDLFAFQDVISLFVSGHTHTGMQKSVQGVSCVVNPRGYENENPGFNPALVVRV